jgi:hypothetical protein
MNFSYFDELPGVGEVNIYRRAELDAESTLIDYTGAQIWIEELAYLQLGLGGPVKTKYFKEKTGTLPSQSIKEIPFISSRHDEIFFNSDKHLIAAIMIPVFIALQHYKDFNKLTRLMPYDYIQYFRPVIEPNDYGKIICAIEKSTNNHYKRFLLLLLRKCKTTAKEWLPWLKEYIISLGNEIKSYEEYTVHRDSRVTYTSAKGQDQMIYEFVDRLFNDKKLEEFEELHFIDSCDSPNRAGEILYHKLVQTNYRFDITPINIFGIHLFADNKITDLILKIANHPSSSDNNRKYAKLALQRLDVN